LELDIPDEWEKSTIYWKVKAIDSYGAIQESLVNEFSTISYYNPSKGTLKGYVLYQFGHLVF